MRRMSLAALMLLGTASAAVLAQGTIRFDRPIYSLDGTALCPRQEQIAAIRRALDDNDRAAADRIIAASCRTVAPDTQLTVVARPGLYDADVEVSVARVAGVDPAAPRGRRWTLKSMVRN